MLSSIYVIRGNISSHYPSDVGRFYHSQIIKSLFCLYEQNYQENSATATHEFSIFFIKGKFFISSLFTLPKVEPRFCVFNKNYDEESKKKILPPEDFEVQPCFCIYCAGKYNYSDSRVMRSIYLQSNPDSLYFYAHCYPVFKVTYTGCFTTCGHYCGR